MTTSKEYGLHSNSKRYLNFSLGPEEYGIPLLSVREVIAVPDVTPIPFSPTHFLGIMNLRGQVISIIDLRAKLGIKGNNTSEMAVIICDLGAVSLGVVVDSINSVIAPNESELSDRPELTSNKVSEYITKVFRKDKKLVLLLDIAKALDVKDLEIVSKQSDAVKAA